MTIPTLDKKIVDDNLAPLLLKKIKLEVRQGQTILQIGEKHQQITEMLEANNLLTRSYSLEEVMNDASDFAETLRTKGKAFTYVIADLDSPALDDLDAFLEKVAPLIIRPGLLILVGTNLHSGVFNKLKMIFNRAPDNFSRPSRAVPTIFMRNKLIEKGYFVKNRFWRYNDKFLIMADIPIKD